MKKNITCLLLVMVLVTGFAFAKSRKEPKVQSTEGIEVTQTDAKNVTNAKTDDKEAKQRTKNRKKLLKNISKIEKFENKKRIKNRDKDFYVNRLNLKKQKLQELSAGLNPTVNSEENPEKENVENTENNSSSENETKGENQK